jgi:hypothetical protein
MLSAAHIPSVTASGGLVLDSSGSGSCIGITQCTMYAPSFDTIGSQDLVILQVLLNNTGTVTSVTSNQGLTWTQRAEVANGLGGKESEWFAVATQVLSNPSISVTDSMARVRVGIEILGISGYDTANPFDPIIKTPTTATGTSNIIEATIGTNDAYDFLIGLEYGGSGTMFNAGTGFTGICLNAPGCATASLDPASSEYGVAIQTSSSTVVSMTQTGGSSWGLIADAVESALPTVASVSPNQGIVGTRITIFGTSFISAVTVKFCGTTQPFTVVNDTSIATTAPQVSSPSVMQVCDVVVTNGAGTSVPLGAAQFSFLPSVASVSPTSGGNETVATVIGTSFVGTTAATVCGVPQPKFTVINDTMIRMTISNIGMTESKPCDVVIANAIGRSSTSKSDLFTYTPQSGGTTNHVPNTPTNSRKILYITIAGIAAAVLIAVAGLMRRWDPSKKEHRHVQAQEEPASNPPLPAR